MENANVLMNVELILLIEHKPYLVTGSSGMAYGRYLIALAALSPLFSAGATNTVIPDSALVASTGYYTDDLGQVMITTGGGHSANIGAASGRNDDGYRGPVNLGFNFTLYGNTYDSLYINNNGNVSFGGGISAFVPEGPTGADQPIVSPFFGDVDTQNPLSGVVHYQLDTPGQLVVTWDNVGRYNSRGDLLDSFQLVLRSDDYVLPAGEGQIGFFYKNMDWDLTDTSTVAAIGFGDGSGNSTTLEGSLVSGLNNIVENHHIWFNADLVPVPPSGVPEPASWAMMVGGFGLIGAAMRRRHTSVSIA